MKQQALAVWLAILLLWSVVPGAAQEEDPLQWIPADFSGFVRLQIREGDTLTALNVAAFAASFLQPERAEFEPLQNLETVIPLTQLDVDDASYVQDIFPWLADEIILAYPAFGPDLQVDEPVMILPTRDVLQSASSLRRILDGQDILERETYQGITLYLADKTTITFLPGVVLVGPVDAVKAMIDLDIDGGERLIDQPSYTSTRHTGNAIATGYIDGTEVRRALSVLTNGDESAEPVFEDLSAVLATYRDTASLEQLVLANQLDGVGFSMQADTLMLGSVRVNLNLYDADFDAEITDAGFNTAVLNLMPQNAMIVHSGTDVPGAVYDLLAALPLANFASDVVGAFPVQPTPAASAGLEIPQDTDIEQALGGLLAVLNREANFDFDHDLLQHLNGSYAVALLPRPNDPLPPLNIPYDMLLVAEAEDTDAALAGATRLVQILLAVDSFETETVGGQAFETVAFNGQPLVQIGVVDNLLVVATGAALDPSLDARRGDDRLVERERWQDVSGEAVPQLYVDIPAVYSTFLPQVAATQLQQIRQLGIRSDYKGDGLFQMQLIVTLPGQFS